MLQLKLAIKITPYINICPIPIQLQVNFVLVIISKLLQFPVACDGEELYFPECVRAQHYVLFV